MKDLPTGTVTFLFTDIEGSTALLQRLGDWRYAEILEEHRRLLRDAIAQGHGQEVNTQGDAFLVAFSRARDAVAAAVAGQRALATHAWPEDASLAVRMGLHTGEPVSGSGDYAGLDVHRAARICAAGHGGQVLLSDAVGVLAVRDLPGEVTLKDLGVHRLKDLRDPEHLLQVVHPDLSTDFPPLKSLGVLPNNLPRQLTSFIGREREMAEVKRLLSTAHLLTLTGAGGSGKTRLALQVAADMLEDFTDGVWWVDLGPLADLQLVPQTVASALNLREEPARRLVDTLVDYLLTRRLLLVLDNCEHLLSACAELANALLRQCSHLKILVTSREGISVAGETLYPVPSLSVPDQRIPSLEQFARYEAVQLFTERATAILPSFKVTHRNADAIAQVCRRLDGIPLAIELAAARVKVLPVEQIAARLDHQFRLLTGGSRVALPRHQTLRAAMDWSYDLLSDQERVLLRRLSVFAGGWTLEAAEAVCAGHDVVPSDVLDLLTHLVDKSLVIAEDRGGEGRYRMLETVRQYGRDRLLESGESDEVRARHRDYFFALLEKAGPHVGWQAGPEKTAWLDRLGADYDNLRAAMDWSVQSGAMERVLEPLKTLEEFRDMRGHWREALQSLEPILSATNRTHTPLRAWALVAAAASARRLGDNARALALVEEAVAMNRALQDKRGLHDSLRGLGIIVYRRGDYRRAVSLFEEANALLDLGDRRDKRRYAFMLYLLGVVARLQGDYQKAETLCNESLALNRALGNTEIVARSLDGLGLVALCLGDYERANSFCQEALALAKREGAKYGTISHLNSLAFIACAAGNYADATAIAEESLSLASDLGEKGAIARALIVLARAAFNEGDRQKAARLHKESLAIFRDLEEILGVAQCLEGLGIVVAESTPDRAARLLAAAEGLRDKIGAPRPPSERATMERSLKCIRDALSSEAFASAWAEGRAMTLEQAIEYALTKED